MLRGGCGWGDGKAVGLKRLLRAMLVVVEVAVKRLLRAMLVVVEVAVKRLLRAMLVVVGPK